jgi:hypothetical protein
MLKKVACSPHCHPSAHENGCVYARIFEPRSGPSAPSGFRDPPRPFVFRAAHLDGDVQPGGAFSFDLHLFDRSAPTLDACVLALERLGTEGMGPRRGRAKLSSVEQLAPDDPGGSLCPISISLEPGAEAADSITVRFVTPTELKAADGLAARPDFPILFARIRDRISLLRTLYGAGPLDVDFRAMGEKAESIAMSGCEVQHERSLRRSSRTGQIHPLGGFTGIAEYRGELREFLPYLHAARWTGVGRQTVWGKGEIRVTAQGA